MKSSVVVPLGEFIEQTEALAVIRPRIKQYDGDIRDQEEELIQNPMATHERMSLPDAGEEEDVPAHPAREGEHLLNEGLRRGDIHQLFEQKVLALIFLHGRDLIQNAFVAQQAEERFIQVALHDMVRGIGIRLKTADTVLHHEFFGRGIAKYKDAQFITNARFSQKGRI